MFNRFKWSAPSVARNRFTARYEPVQPFIFCAFASALEVEIIFDIGANIGQYSIFASQIPTAKEIYAYEAEETAFGELVQNINLNGLQSRVKPHCIAVSSQNGEVDFAVAKPMAGNNAIAATSIHRHAVYQEFRKMPCVALDAAHDISARKLCFKVDVEGHESDVLKGAGQLLEKNTCMAQVEVYQDAGIVTKLFERFGYQKIFSAGVDHYFSNAPEFKNSAQVVSVIEQSMAEIIQYNLKG
jgi:FkbM family methyltransferase